MWSSSHATARRSSGTNRAASFRTCTDSTAGSARRRWRFRSSPGSPEPGRSDSLLVERQDFADLEEAAERLHHLGVELSAGGLTQAADRFVCRQAPAVGAVGDHRVEGVADEHDACLHRDLLTRLAVRVAEPVPALVAGAHDRAYVGEAVDRGEDPL